METICYLQFRVSDLRTDCESRKDCTKLELGVLYFKPRFFLTRMEACERCEKLQIRRKSKILQTVQEVINVLRTGTH
jgi:hypothetical protein